MHKVSSSPYVLLDVLIIDEVFVFMSDPPGRTNISYTRRCLQVFTGVHEICKHQLENLLKLTQLPSARFTAAFYGNHRTGLVELRGDGGVEK